MPKITKDYSMWIHTAGGSEQKGTTAILTTWVRNAKLPLLTIMKWTESPLSNISPQNLNWTSYRLPLKEFRKKQNKAGIHVCLSETEGYGHYLMEAMSCKAVVLTTDAPPMNEFIKDKRCLVPYNHTAQQNLATNYYVSCEEVEIAVNRILSLSQAELKAIGKENRARYLKLKKAFYSQLKKLINTL